MRQHHVRRLQISVDKAVIVRVLDRIEHLQEVGDRALAPHRSEAAHDRLQGLAADVLHDDEGLAVHGIDAIDRGHVRMVEARKRKRLGTKARHYRGAPGELGTQDLQGDFAVK